MEKRWKLLPSWKAGESRKKWKWASVMWWQRGETHRREAGQLVGWSGTQGPAHHQPLQWNKGKSHLFGRHIIASKASGGTQIFHQRIERLGLLVENPDLERKRVSMTLLFCPQWVRMEGIFNQHFRESQTNSDNPPQEHQLIVMLPWTTTIIWRKKE